MAKYVTVQVSRKEPPGPPEAEGERCKKCGHPLAPGELETSLYVCPYCGYHYLIPAHTRVAQLADPGSVVFVTEEVRATDPLEFYDLRPYPDRLSEAQIETGLTEAMLAATCTVENIPVALGVMDFRFMGGSMGSVVGERFWRLAQTAVAERRALVVVAASGGARMQEGLFSLMQMAKVVVAVRVVAEAGLPYMTVLTHPSTGGVFASLATVADVIMAEPGAVMQFAGRRIIEQTTREKLPPDFGSSEKQLLHGQIDMVVDRRDLKARLAWCLHLVGGFDCPGQVVGPAAKGQSRENNSSTAEQAEPATEEGASPAGEGNERESGSSLPEEPASLRHSYQAEALRLLERLHQLRNLPALPGISYLEEIQKIQARLEALREHDGGADAWKTVQLARHADRPQTLEYVSYSLPDFLELRGDRLQGDDKAVVGGVATLGSRRIMLIGHQKGHTLKERQERNFGMARPEGYRKAMRLVKLAEKFGLPVVTLVDTPGAYPGKDAEERGQASAIAHSMETFIDLAVPTVSVVIGEGGSGGALALAVTDRVLMLENSIYSVISPEGCAALLWRNAAEAARAAEALALTADDLRSLGLVDGVIPEPAEGAHTDPKMAVRRVMQEVQQALDELDRLEAQQRVQQRREKYLAMGRFRLVE